MSHQPEFHPVVGTPRFRTDEPIFHTRGQGWLAGGLLFASCLYMAGRTVWPFVKNTFGRDTKKGRSIAGM